jgi:hypothetical protein
MKKAILSALLLGAVVVFPAQAQTYNLTLTGASPGGLWSRIGGGIDAAIAKAYPGSTITYQTSSGGLTNVRLVSDGKAPLGMVSDGALALAKAGSSPYKSPVSNVRVLFRAYTAAARFQATHVIVNKDFADKHGVKSFADVVNKKLPIRIAINRRGNLDSDIGAMVLAEMGGTRKAIESWGGQVVHAASKEMVALMLDRRIDAIALGISFNHPRIREIAKGISPVLLSIPTNVAQKVANKYGGEVCTFKKGEYKFAPAGGGSVCIGVLVVVSDKMDNKTAYDLAKAMISEIDTFKDKSHRLIKKTASKKSMTTKSVVPFHPGAAKYYKEAGLM